MDTVDVTRRGGVATGGRETIDVCVVAGYPISDIVNTTATKLDGMVQGGRGRIREKRDGKRDLRREGTLAEGKYIGGKGERENSMMKIIIISVV